MIKSSWLIWCLLFRTAFLFAQPYKNIRLPEPRKKSYFYSFCEPSIAINTNKPNELIAGSLLNHYYYSNDGGQNWTHKKMKSKYGVYGDPVMLFNKHNEAFFFHLADYKGVFIDRIVCQKAEKLDKKFTKGSFPKPNEKKAQDKHWVAYDYASDIIYMTWTQFDKYGSKNPQDSSIIVFSKSLDRGETWTNPKRISYYAGDCIDSDNTVEGAFPSVGKNGELFVIWTGPKGLVFQKSLDKGETWFSKEKFIEEQHQGWDLEIPGISRCNGLPTLFTDTSRGKYHGRLYLHWSDQFNGTENTDVFIKYSDDNGETWSDRIKVNQDNTKSHQFFSWMCIDQANGNIHFVYFDRRNYMDELKTDVVWAYSKDGGLTFQEEIISESPFIPNKKVFFGDYNNICAFDNSIHPIWPRMDNNQISLWTTILKTY